MDVRKKEHLNFSSIATRFNYPESCILQEHPWRNIDYDQNLWNEIVRATPRPKYIRNAAGWIRDLLFGEDEYAAMHWRYNKNDWGKHCGSAGEWRSCPIYELGTKNPALFAQKLTKLLKEKNIYKLYIAAPPDQSRLVETFKDEILKIDGKFDVLVGLDAVKLLQIRARIEFNSLGMKG
ncbi:Oidioi.mRNA.OKI2018_I69.chr1.g3058.t1.cds [Oikopleura dioica]|uniref:Oidioi.mRNA.OKI2018_I69.chr1.g3058.t1.cds n=1 Tax=Oikopleura dioica TaxID=34765 RepID=A0ABN7SSW0_OIKDI|nr:Oidioi.mRNA.OKI2018_I69.chr1.g3058.t1.cds [Oikopleura dioica]